jgi:hypothetical protein
MDQFLASVALSDIWIIQKIGGFHLDFDLVSNHLQKWWFSFVMIHLPTEGPPKTSRIRYDALMTWSLFFYFTAYSQMFAALSASI